MTYAVYSSMTYTLLYLGMSNDQCPCLKWHNLIVRDDTLKKNNYDATHSCHMGSQTIQIIIISGWFTIVLLYLSPCP